MFRKLAVAVFVVVLSAGSAARAGGGEDWEMFLHSPNGAFDEDPFFDLYPPGGLTDTGADGLYDSPGDDTFEARSPFFDVLIPRQPGIIDNGDPGIIDNDDPGVMTDALWLELLMSMGW